MKRRFVIFTLCNAGLILITEWVNSALGAHNVHLFLLGLTLVFPTRFLPLGWGAAAVALPSLWGEAATPYAFGLQSTLLLLTFIILRRVQVRMRLTGRLADHQMAFFANLLIFLGLAIAIGPGGGPLLPFVWRSLSDLLFSQLAAFIVAAWYLNFQDALLILSGTDLLDEPQSEG